MRKSTRAAALGVATPDPGRDHLGDAVQQRLEVVRQRGGVEGALDRDHPAADVDADRGGDDGSHGRDDRADGGAHADMGVGHQRHMTRDERQVRRPLRLGDRGVLEVRAPRQHVADLGLGHLRVFLREQKTDSRAPT